MTSFIITMVGIVVGIVVAGGATLAVFVASMWVIDEYWDWRDRKTAQRRER